MIYLKKYPALSKNWNDRYLISHNMDDVARLAQRLIVMNNGEISIDDKPEQVF